MSTRSAAAPGSASAEPRGGRGLGAWLFARPRLRLGLLLSAPMAWLVLLYLGSLAVMISASFWSLAPFTGSLVKTFSLSNFQTLLTASVYRDVALRSVGVAIAVTLIDAILAMPIAFFAAKVVRSAKLQYAIMIAATMPLWAGYLVKGYAWRIMLDHNGVLDWALAPFGLHGPGLGLPATIIALAYLWLPYMILPLYAGFDRISSSLTDASSDLGAKAGFTFRSVVLPMIAPALVAGSIFTFSLSLGDYIMVKIVGATTQMFANVVYDNIGVAGNLPFAAAAATFPILVVVGYLWAVRRTGALENL